MPFYRNWPEIVEIGQKDELVMLVLARISLEEGDELFVRFQRAFPECFSDHEVCGPFPYSVIRQRAEEDAEACRRQEIVWYGMEQVLGDLGVPYIRFEVMAPDFERNSDDPLFPLAWEEAKKLKPCEAFEWKGVRLVILENDCGDDPGFYNTIVAVSEEIILLDR